MRNPHQLSEVTEVISRVM